MQVIYELNPPKIIYDSAVNMDVLYQEIDKFLKRAQTIANVTNFIHITDSVLGIPRISSLHGAGLIRENTGNAKLNLSCSVRTRDRNINSIIQFATQSVSLKINDLLFIMGDEPQMNISPNAKTSLSKPTEVINALNSLGYGKLMNLYLSVPNRVSDFKAFTKKIKSHPHGLITQSIDSLQEVKDLKKMVEPYATKLIPCVMVPSKKNTNAAKMVGLDWKEYENNILDFIYDIGEFADQILITSPNDFSQGLEILRKL